MPAMQLDNTSCNAKPRVNPVNPSPAISALMSTPQVPSSVIIPIMAIVTLAILAAKLMAGFLDFAFFSKRLNKNFETDCPRL